MIQFKINELQIHLLYEPDRKKWKRLTFVKVYWSIEIKIKIETINKNQAQS